MSRYLCPLINDAYVFGKTRYLAGIAFCGIFFGGVLCITKFCFWVDFDSKII
jgi:hypothetical protein